MRLLIFGGTTEGRLLAEELTALGAEVTVSVATPLGAEELAGLKAVDLWVGRKTAGEMQALLSGFDLCIDATHPYAVEATANIAAACRRAGIPLRRLLRASTEAAGVVRVNSPAEAAAFLQKTEGNILLTTGVKELDSYRGLNPARLYARVLPTCESIAACERLGLPHRNILALQGPFTRRMNGAMLEQYRIAWLVTKDGGGPGGMAEKLRAAEDMGIPVILIGRPAETGETMEEIVRQVRERMA